MSWRLIYENKKVYGLFTSSGITLTNNNLFVSDTLEECFDEIDSLELTMIWFSGDTTEILFSAGTRTIINKPDDEEKEIE